MGAATLTLTLTACDTSGHGLATEAGIPVSYGDYHDMCKVYSGEVVRGMNVERRWTQAQHDELWDLIAADPDCQAE